ncbi:hypothetical protein REPUB_Repub03eG0256100 [Reevesia pubescens]
MSVLQVLRNFSEKEVTNIVDLTWKSLSFESKEGLVKNNRKRGRLDDDGHDGNGEKKMMRLINSLKKHVHPFVENRPPPKLKLLSFDDAVANLGKNNITKPKTKTNKTSLSVGRVANTRTNNASSKLKSHSYSKPKQTPKQTHKITSLNVVVDEPTLSHQKPQQSADADSFEPEPKPTLSQQHTPPMPDISPRKALRAAQLKSRFASTIFKAQHHTLFDSAGCKEEAAAVQWTRERERETARIALNKVEEAADGRDNLQIFKELEELCGCSLSCCSHHPLHMLGLRLKA